MQHENGVASYSIIDHFAVNELFFNKLEAAGVIHSGENLSNHEAIFIKFKVGEFDPVLELPPSVTRTCWSKASSAAKIEYKKVLSQKER